MAWRQEMFCRALKAKVQNGHSDKVYAAREDYMAVKNGLSCMSTLLTYTPDCMAISTLFASHVRIFCLTT